MTDKLHWVLAGIGDIARRRVIAAIQAEPRSTLYGFITREGATDVFVHASSFTGVPLASVRPGKRVAFEVGVGSRGAQARKVALV